MITSQMHSNSTGEWETDSAKACGLRNQTMMVTVLKERK
jgi:hypothetical protein